MNIRLALSLGSTLQRDLLMELDDAVQLLDARVHIRHLHTIEQINTDLKKKGGGEL